MQQFNELQLTNQHLMVLNLAFIMNYQARHQQFDGMCFDFLIKTVCGFLRDCLTREEAVEANMATID